MTSRTSRSRGSSARGPYILMVYAGVLTDLSELLQRLEGFQWDAGNSEKNWRRHRVTQAECEQVFANQPLLLSSAAAASAEPRYFALGRTDVTRELTIVFTVRSNLVRVISARPMSRRERKEYARAKAAVASGEADS